MAKQQPSIIMLAGSGPRSEEEKREERLLTKDIVDEEQKYENKQKSRTKEK